MRTTLNQNDFRRSSKMLPQELIDNIMLYTSFFKCISISNYAANKLFDRELLTWHYFYTNIIDLQILKCLHFNKIDGWVLKALNACIKYGKPKEAIYIIENMLEDELDLVYYNHNKYTARRLKYFAKIKILNSLLRYSDLNKIKWFCEKFPNCKVTRQSMIYAVKSKNLDIVKYVWESRSNKNYKNLIRTAIMSNATLEIIKFFVEQKIPFSGDVFLEAINNNKCDIAIYLFPKCKKIPSIMKNQEHRIFRIALYYESLELVKLLYNAGYEYDQKQHIHTCNNNLLTIDSFLRNKIDIK